ncbi:MAG: ABC transporter ATP-binding protein, partial [Bacilli bacterium]
NIKLPAEFSSKEFDKDFFNKIVSDLGISDLLDKFPSELSGGQQQRVAIARALINKPKILLADEPTGNLDSHNANKVIKLLVGIAAKYEMSLLIVSHDHLIAKQCQRIIFVKDGKIHED